MNPAGGSPFKGLKMADEISIAVTKHVPAKKGSLDGSFVVSFKCGTVLNFEVKRSVSDFIELDRRIRKRYPRSNLYKLILDTKPEGRKRSHSVCQPEDLRQHSNKSRRGMDGKFIYTQSSIAELEQEKMEELLASLTDYMQFMLTQHELVASDELLQFLDQEQNSMYIVNKQFAPPTIHEVLLSKLAARKVVVARSEEQTRAAACGQLLVWQFSTTNYDIGFSVEVNGEVKVPYTRYAAHEKVITGTLEINTAAPVAISSRSDSITTSPIATRSSSIHDEKSPIKKAILLGGTLPASLTKAPKPTGATSVNCVLKWDNTYALLRSKELNYKIAVVEVADYEAAKARALELEHQHKQFELLRHSLKLELLRHAVTLSAGVHYSSSFEHEQAILAALRQSESARTSQQLEHEQGARESAEKRHEELERQLAEATREVQSYEDEFDATVETLQEAEAAKEAAEKARDAIFTSWKFAVSQLEAAQSDLQAARATNRQQAEEKESMQCEIAALRSEMQQLKSMHETEMLLLRTDKDMLISSLQHQLQQKGRQPLTSPKGAANKAKFNKIFRKNASALQSVDTNAPSQQSSQVVTRSNSVGKTTDPKAVTPSALAMGSISL